MTNRKPGCYYGPDRPEADPINCRVCGYCRGWTDGYARSTVGPDDAGMLTFGYSASYEDGQRYTDDEMREWDRLTHEAALRVVYADNEREFALELEDEREAGEWRDLGGEG